MAFLKFSLPRWSKLHPSLSYLCSTALKAQSHPTHNEALAWQGVVPPSTTICKERPGVHVEVIGCIAATSSVFNLPGLGHTHTDCFSGHGLGWVLSAKLLQGRFPYSGWSMVFSFQGDG